MCFIIKYATFIDCKCREKSLLYEIQGGRHDSDFWRVEKLERPWPAAYTAGLLIQTCEIVPNSTVPIPIKVRRDKLLLISGGKKEYLNELDNSFYL